MPLKEGGKGHQQTYDPSTGKYGSGNAEREDTETKKDYDKVENDDKKMKQEEDKVEKSEKQDMKPIDLIDKLINEEIDAIKSYTIALRVFKEVGNEKAIERLFEIRADEHEHKKELEELKKVL